MMFDHFQQQKNVDWHNKQGMILEKKLLHEVDVQKLIEYHYHKSKGLNQYLCNQ
jgi:hypothetical protein